MLSRSRTNFNSVLNSNVSVSSRGRLVFNAVRFDTFPNADHVVRSHSHDVVVVVRGRDLVDDDVVAVEGYFARVLQMIVLKLGPHQPR